MNGYEDMLKSLQVDDDTLHRQRVRKHLMRAIERNQEVFEDLGWHLKEYFEQNDVSPGDAACLVAMFVADLHWQMLKPPEDARGVRYFHDMLDVAFDAISRTEK